MLVIDDALLLAVLAGGSLQELDEAGERGDLYTTGSWYYRLARAVNDPTFTGFLTSALVALPPARQARALAGLDELPQQIGLVNCRYLVPVMRRLDVGVRLNFLTAEAVAAAQMLDSGIRVTTEAPLLRRACEALGIDLGVISI